MKKLALLIAITTMSCQTTTPPPTPTPTGQPARLEVAPDTAQRLVQLPKTPIDYDRSLLNDNEKQVVAKLIEASRYVDEIYWRQVSAENPDLRARLQAQAADSPLDRAGYEYFLANKGRWDRLKLNDPFIAPFGPAGHKPDGAALYPADMTKREFEGWANDAARGFFTVIRRGSDEKLQAIPYSIAYQADLTKAAKLLDEAAALTSNKSLQDFLKLRAKAFLSNDYYDSDVAWMKLDAPIDITIGPYETYM
ncbi:MAG: dipeptidyl-peptidase 3 family protein, partial [Thermoanaerobaculia bacterium]